MNNRCNFKRLEDENVEYIGIHTLILFVFYSTNFCVVCGKIHELPIIKLSELFTHHNHKCGIYCRILFASILQTIKFLCFFVERMF